MKRTTSIAMTTAAFAFVIALTVVTPKTALTSTSDDLYLYPKVDDMTATTTLSAKSGACDGFHRCRCGVTAARLAGLPLNYHGLNLKQAASYYALPRTSCHAGAIGVQPHHVYTVLSCNGDGTAQVHDDAGIYTRRVAGNTFVDPNGNVATRLAQHHATRTYSARSHRHRTYQQVAYHYEMRDPARIGW